MAKKQKEREKKKKSFLSSKGVKKINVRIIGIGGGGGTIVSEISKRIERVSFVSANTDLQALKHIPKNVRAFSFGEDTTGGLGTGMDFKLSEKLAEKETERIKKLFRNQDICIFLSTLGGGTGSGASPVFAKIAQEFPLLTLGIFTLPFRFEGKKKFQIAKNALDKMKPYLNGWLIIPNERIFQMVDKNTSLRKALLTLNRMLAENLKEIIDLIFEPGLINIDFADFKTILENKGNAFFINTIRSSGKERVEKITKSIFSSPLTEYNLKKVDGILFNIAGVGDLKMDEVAKISRAVSLLNKNAKIIFGISRDRSFKLHEKKSLTQGKKEIKLTILMTGSEEEVKKKKKKKKKALREKKEIPSEIITKKKKEKKVAQKKKKKKLKKKTEGNSKKKKKEKGKKRKEEKGEEKKKEMKKVETPKERSRRTALEIKKALTEEEKELLNKEKEWETPAFLRKGLTKRKIRIVSKNK